MRRLSQCQAVSNRPARHWRLAVLPGARVLPGRFNVAQMAIGVRKRAESALISVDEFVNKIRSDVTVQKAINEAGLRGVRVP